MRKPAKHHVWHDGKLLLNSGTNVRGIVAVTRSPPGRDTVNELASVCKHNAAAMRARDGQGRRRGFHLRIGQPDLLQSGAVPDRSSPLGFQIMWHYRFHSGSVASILT